MPTAYLEDVREAAVTALLRFERHETGEFVQHFEVATVNVMFNIRKGEGPGGGQRWDYGHPTMYELHPSCLGELETWWQEVAPTGSLLPPQYKPMLNAWEVNLVCDQGNRRFNYHVAVQ